MSRSTWMCESDFLTIFSDKGSNQILVVSNIFKSTPENHWCAFKNMAEKEGFEPSIEL